jgi:hypothetical protein
MKRSHIPLGLRLARAALRLDPRPFGIDLVFLRADHVGGKPTLDGAGVRSVLLFHLGEQFPGGPIIRIELRRAPQGLLRPFGLIGTEIGLTEQSVRRTMVGRATHDREHLYPGLVVAPERQQRHPQQQPHVQLVGTREQNTPTRPDRLLVPALGDEALGVRRKVLNVGAHSAVGSGSKGSGVAAGLGRPAATTGNISG